MSGVNRGPRDRKPKTPEQQRIAGELARAHRREQIPKAHSAYREIIRQRRESENALWRPTQLHSNSTRGQQ